MAQDANVLNQNFFESNKNKNEKLPDNIGTETAKNNYSNEADSAYPVSNEQEYLKEEPLNGTDAIQNAEKYTDHENNNYTGILGCPDQTDYNYHEANSDDYNNLNNADIRYQTTEERDAESPAVDETEIPLPEEEDIAQEDDIEEEIEQKPDISASSLGCSNASEAMNSDNELDTSSVELVATDLSLKHKERTPRVRKSSLASEVIVKSLDNNLLNRNDELPRDLSMNRRLSTPFASPRRVDITRAPSRESDSMQSPQPSGIPAVPSSPEVFPAPPAKCKQTLFLESLLSSPSPKMYTSEVTITKQQYEPLNLGKNRKSASPTVTSCSDEMKKLIKEYGEPLEKRLRRESHSEPTSSEIHCTRTGSNENRSDDETNHVNQYHDHEDEPRRPSNTATPAPSKETPESQTKKPELKIPDGLQYPIALQDPDMLIISLQQLEGILESNKMKNKNTDAEKSAKTSISNHTATSQGKVDQPSQSKASATSGSSSSGDSEPACSPVMNQMMWVPYLSQMEAAMACSQNMELLKALAANGYSTQSYQDMLNASSRYMNVLPGMEYDSRSPYAMWQATMNANMLQSQKLASETAKEASKSNDVQNPYVHSTKSREAKSHSAARTSPIAHTYNCQRGTPAANSYMHGMYPMMNQSRANMALSSMAPYLNTALCPRTSRTATSSAAAAAAAQKSPTSPYYPNNNYLQSVKALEKNKSGNAANGNKPRISVKNLQNLMDPATREALRRRQGGARRREEPEVGSTTEPPPQDHQLWHPLFGNQKNYANQWSWTQVTATGD